MLKGFFSPHFYVLAHRRLGVSGVTTTPDHIQMHLKCKHLLLGAHITRILIIVLKSLAIAK